MADLNIERKDDNKKNSKWWIWVIVAIIALIILWLVFDDRTDLQRDEETEIENTETMIQEPTP